MSLPPPDVHEAEERRAVASDNVSGADQGEHETLMPSSPLPEASKADVYTPLRNPSTGAVLSAATYNVDDSAFATWCEVLTTSVLEESRALQDHVIELQKDFDDASQYIRGDYAWRKQVATFHDRTNDIVTSVMQGLRERLELCMQSLSTSLDDTLKVKDALANEEMQRQARTYEDKLRRSRTSLKKEIDRFTNLEKCLRKEEAHQAKTMYDHLVGQLRMEYAAKEATLQAMLRELNDAYRTIENANMQLMDTVKSKDGDIERLKKLLPKINAVGTQRGNGTMRPASAASNTIAGVAAAASDAYVQSLKQSLQSANSTIDSLRKQADEAAGDKEVTLKKLRLTEEAAAKTSDELSKVKQLLSESHGTLVANRKEVDTLMLEKTHWKELYDELHFQRGSHEHALADARRLTEVAQARIKSLENQRKQGGVDEAALAQFTEEWRRWREDVGGSQILSLEAALQLVDSFISHCSTATRNDTTEEEDETTARRREWEAKLHLEFEQKYGNMLNLRIIHERKRVLARIEMIWNKRVEDAASSGSVTSFKSKRLVTYKETRQVHLKTTAATATGVECAVRGASLKQILQLVAEAFSDLGFSDWANTDVDMLRDEVTTLRETLGASQKAYGEIQQLAEAQVVTAANAELQLREKEMLLAELTDRYRVLRAHVEKLQETQGPGGGDAPAPLDLSRWDARDPFTVYGHPQPIEEKRRSVRPRPVSASATLVTTPIRSTDNKMLAIASSHPAPRATVAGRSGHRRASAPKPFLLSHLPDVQLNGNSSTATTPLVRTIQQVEDHVRSVLKADLLSLTPIENQLEDGSHVGADGVRYTQSLCSVSWSCICLTVLCCCHLQILQIMQRRRHLK
jgi:hypothetical protein